MNYGMCMEDIQNIGPFARFYNTRLCKRMENEEWAQLEVHYQELEDLKNNMAQMANLLEQFQRVQSGKGHLVSNQPCYHRQQLWLSPLLTKHGEKSC